MIDFALKLSVRYGPHKTFTTAVCITRMSQEWVVRFSPPPPQAGGIASTVTPSVWGAKQIGEQLN